MIYEVKDLKGNSRYYDDKTGNEVRHQNRIPDDAFRFLTLAVGKQQVVHREKMNRSEIRHLLRQLPPVAPDGPSWWSRLVMWFKNLFNGNN